MPQRNLAVELLRKLLVGEIKTRSQRNAVQGAAGAVDPQISEPRDRNRAR
jgi:type I restriction enzyme R subunit